MMEEVRLKVPPGRLLIQEARCPAGCSLMNPDKLLCGKPAITCDIRLRGQSGLIHLNSFFGIFEYESELLLHPGDIVDLRCPHCNVPLAIDELCRVCRVPMFALHLPDGGEVQACPKVGCHNHSLVIVDIDAQIARFYNEERRPKM